MLGLCEKRQPRRDKGPSDDAAPLSPSLSDKGIDDSKKQCRRRSRGAAGPTAAVSVALGDLAASVDRLQRRLRREAGARCSDSKGNELSDSLLPTLGDGGGLVTAPPTSSMPPNLFDKSALHSADDAAGKAHELGLGSKSRLRGLNKWRPRTEFEKDAVSVGLFTEEGMVAATIVDEAAPLLRGRRAKGLESPLSDYPDAGAATEGTVMKRLERMR